MEIKNLPIFEMVNIPKGVWGVRFRLSVYTLGIMVSHKEKPNILPRTVKLFLCKNGRPLYLICKIIKGTSKLAIKNGVVRWKYNCWREWTKIET